MVWVDGGDAECRYLPEFESREGRFSSLLKELGVALPNGVSLLDAVRWGWIRPRLRVELPSSFIAGWRNFPEHPMKGELPLEDGWAARAWTAASCPWPGWGSDLTEPEPADWYLHPFDRSDHEWAVEARRHAIPAGPGAREPAGVPHPRFRDRLVLPWIDYYSYWQAYEVWDVVNSAALLPPAYNTPNARREAHELGRWFQQLREEAERRIARSQRRWEATKRIFDWISRFRTLRGASLVRSDGWWERYARGARALASSLGLTPETVRADLRDTLLVLWGALGAIHYGDAPVDASAFPTGHPPGCRAAQPDSAGANRPPRRALGFLRTGSRGNGPDSGTCCPTSETGHGSCSLRSHRRIWNGSMHSLVPRSVWTRAGFDGWPELGGGDRHPSNVSSSPSCGCTITTATR